MTEATILFVTEVAPSKQSLNGFSQRVYHFLKALGTETNVYLALICIGHQQPDSAGMEELSLAGAEILRVGEGRFATSRWGKARRAARYVLPSPPASVYPMHLRAFDDLVERLEPHVVITHLPLLAGLGLGLPPRIKLVSLLEEATEQKLQTSLASHGYLHRSVAIRTEARRMRAFYRRVGARSNLSVLISDEERDYLRRFLPNDGIVVIPHGIDCDVFDAALISDEVADFDVGVFGDLAQPRNWLALREVLATAARSGAGARDWRWLLVGNVGDAAKQNLQEFPGVTMTGFVEDIRPWYGRAKVTLVPALPGPGVKTTVLQAWAMQRAVVTTEAGIRGLPAERGVNVLIGSSPAEVVDAVEQALASPRLREEVGRAGRETVLTQRRIEALAARFSEHCARVLTASDA